MLQRGAEVQFGEDVVVPAGTTTPSVVAFGGDITVDGTVTDAVVAFGGDVTIRGTVGTSTVVFGGDVTVGPDAVLGSDLKPSDASLVLFGGKLTQAPGAEVVGQTETFQGVDVGGAFGLAARGILVGPGFSFIGWVVQTAFCLVLALVIAALMPGQLRTVQRNVGRRPWASLGWGALVFFVLDPCGAAGARHQHHRAPAGAALRAVRAARLLLRSDRSRRVPRAEGHHRVRRQGEPDARGDPRSGRHDRRVPDPVAGQLLMLVLMLFGLGASVMAVADWRRRRREAAAAQAAAQAAVAAQYAAAGGAAAQASVITPIVSTAPDVPMSAGQAPAATVPPPVTAVTAPVGEAQPAGEPPAVPVQPAARRPVCPCLLHPWSRRRPPSRRRPRVLRGITPSERRRPCDDGLVRTDRLRGIVDNNRWWAAPGGAAHHVPLPAATTKGDDVSDNAETTIVQQEGVAPATCEAGTTVGLEDAVVQARGVERDYGAGDALVRALAGVDIDLQRGAYTAIMGPSGSGKSTLMHILAGLDRPTAGTVWIDGQEITALKERALTQLRRDQIGFIFQTFNLLPTLTAAENISLPLTIAGRKGDQDWVDELVATVGLGDRLTHQPAELSGGQQQRVAVARALASRPAVLFADEPTGNLDSRTGEEVLQLLRHSRDSMGQTIVMVTHDAHAATYADRIVFLKDGAIAHDCGRLGRDEIYDVIKSLEDV